MCGQSVDKAPCPVPRAPSLTAEDVRFGLLYYASDKAAAANYRARHRYVQNWRCPTCEHTWPCVVRSMADRIMRNGLRGACLFCNGLSGGYGVGSDGLCVVSGCRVCWNLSIQSHPRSRELFVECVEEPTRPIWRIALLDNHRHVLWRCDRGECRGTWSTRPHQLKGCPHCTITGPAHDVRDWLAGKGATFTPEHAPDWLSPMHRADFGELAARRVCRYRLDFYITCLGVFSPSVLVALEVDGCSHFTQLAFMSTPLHERQARDIFKMAQCLQHGVSVVRVRAHPIRTGGSRWQSWLARAITRVPAPGQPPIVLLPREDEYRPMLAACLARELRVIQLDPL